MALLQATNREQVRGPVLIAIQMTEHNRRGRAEALTVSGCHHFQPLRAVQFVGTQDRAHLIVQDLGGGPRQRIQPRIPELPQKCAR